MGVYLFCTNVNKVSPRPARRQPRSVSQTHQTSHTVPYILTQHVIDSSNLNLINLHPILLLLISALAIPAAEAACVPCPALHIRDTGEVLPVPAVYPCDNLLLMATLLTCSTEEGSTTYHSSEESLPHTHHGSCKSPHPKTQTHKNGNKNKQMNIRFIK